MTTAMVPRRNSVCGFRPNRDSRHLPQTGTVESETNDELEWQFGTCMYCEQSIARFRSLRGGLWFDQWGCIDEWAHLISG